MGETQTVLIIHANTLKQGKQIKTSSMPNWSTVKAAFVQFSLKAQSWPSVLMSMQWKYLNRLSIWTDILANF